MNSPKLISVARSLRSPHSSSCLPTCSLFVSGDKGIFNYCNYHLKIGSLPQTIEMRFGYFLSLLMSFNPRFHSLSAVKYVCGHTCAQLKYMRRDPCAHKIYGSVLHMLGRLYSRKDCYDELVQSIMKQGPCHLTCHFCIKSPPSERHPTLTKRVCPVEHPLI